MTAPVSRITVLTVFGRRRALRRIGSQVVAGVRVLVHRRERVSSQRRARAPETRGIHGRVVVTGRSTPGLGPTLIEVVGSRVVICRRPDGVVRHPRMLLELYERGFAAAPGARV